MNEDLLKVPLSPSDGQPRGWFTEGMPVAEALGFVFAFHIDYKSGERRRWYGRVTAVHDTLKNIDNTDPSSEQVLMTRIYLLDAEPFTLVWEEIAVAIAEIAMEAGGA